MHNWVGIALVAYLIGAAIEGVNAASQLSHSLLELTDRDNNHVSEPVDPAKGKWQVFAVIAAVSLCGACLWPCRLVHRSIKDTQSCRND